MSDHRAPRRRHPRSRRVVSGGAFRRAYAQGGRARGAELLVIAVPNGLDQTRLGLSVGKRIWKSAVKRNRIRRVFREAFRLSYAELPKGYDLVLIPAVPRLAPRLGPISDALVRLAAKAAAKADRKRDRGAGAPRP